MKIDLNWQDFKTQLNNGLPYKYLSIGGVYYIYAVDGNFEFQCIIKQNNGDDQQDFEANYKNTAYNTLSQFDTDGASIVRIKAAKKGWSFLALPIEITTSTIDGSLYCKNSIGNDISGISCKVYDGSNVEITDESNLTLCEKTQIDIELPFDYELIGGALRINSNPATDIRLWIVGAPDIPANLGGSKEFASGINLKFLAPDSSFDIDGRVTKFIQYNPTLHTGKLRIILKHPAGSQVNMQFVMHIYRQ